MVVVACRKAASTGVLFPTITVRCQTSQFCYLLSRRANCAGLVRRFFGASAPPGEKTAARQDQALPTRIRNSRQEMIYSTARIAVSKEGVPAILGSVVSISS
jgi:hypothetical protein